MPAITFETRSSLLPRPVTLELYTEKSADRYQKPPFAISICLYPDIIVVDGWTSSKTWLNKLVYTATIARRAMPLIRALRDCAEKLAVSPEWSDLPEKIAPVDKTLSQTLKAELACTQPEGPAALPVAAKNPLDDIELLLKGFANVHSTPTAAFMRGVFNERQGQIRAAIEDFVRKHGRVPDGEIAVVFDGKPRFFVDCAVLRQAADAPRNNSLGRAFYERAESTRGGRVSLAGEGEDEQP